MTSQPPLLLVSVRNVDEALAALDGGADIIDVKEPSRGALGAADAITLQEIAAAVAGRRPLSAAMGELLDNVQEIPLEPFRNYAWVKFGLAQCGLPLDWHGNWRNIRERLNGTCEVVATAYADYKVAKCFEPRKLALAIHREYSIFLLDTASKNGQSVFEHITDEELFMLRCNIRSAGGKFALAGSLRVDHLSHALRFQPEIIGIRGAACLNGREGAVAANKVRAFREALHRACSTIPSALQPSS